MSKEKQIEQVQGDIKVIIHDTIYSISNEDDRKYLAEILYAAGYRKQSEGEWLQGVNNSKVCSVCGKEPLYTASETAFAKTFYRVKSNYCPNCGAKMRKEDEGK